jgi:hypothetical protein
LQPNSSAICAPRGNAHPTRSDIAAFAGVGNRIHRQLYYKSLPQRTTWIRKFILFDRFQFGLPPGWNAIILAAKVGIDPVGVRP